MIKGGRKNKGGVNDEKSKIEKRPAKPTPTKAAKNDEEHIEIVMIAVEDLIPDEDNPNEMDESTFDQLIEEIREQGFDEPIHIRPSPTVEGKFEIGSGHHRTKAAMVLGMTEVPCIIKHWTDREKKVALTKRNVLRGKMNNSKLAKLYKDLVKDRDPATVQKELGFQDRKKFEVMIDEVSKTLPPKQKKKLAEAKENIKTMDDLSSVLNRIFKEAGSQLDNGYLVFSFGGKNHHYFQIDDDTDKKLGQLIAICEEQGKSYTEVMKALVAAADLQSIAASVELPNKPKAATKKTVRKRRAKKG